MPFKGETYDRELDKERLTGIQVRVRDLMADGCWRTPSDVAAALELPFGTDVTRRIRELREEKWGGFDVERERIEGGQWKYRCIKPVEPTGVQGRMF